MQHRARSPSAPAADDAPRRSLRCAAALLALACAAILPALPARAQAPRITPPTIVEGVEPAYPPEALAAGLEGRVVLRLTVDAEGRVIDAQVVESAGQGFDEAALEAARKIRFSPARRGDTPVAARILYAHEFRIDRPAPPPPDPAPPPAGGGEELEVVVRRQSEAERMRRSAEAVQVLELEGEHRESADMGEVLARTEGVGVRRGGGLGSGTRFSLAGFTDDQIRFFLDGVPLELAGHPFGISNVPVNLIERVEIYRGVVPIRFGADALGGAVNLVSRELEPGSHGFASYQIGSFGTHRLAAGASHLAEAGFFARASGFLDRAENDYEITARPIDPETSRELAPRRFERFHDAYAATGGELEVGIVDRPWARKLSLQGFYSGFDKELQHNVVASRVYGDATWSQTTGGASLRYEHALSSGTTVRAIAGYTRERTNLLDVGTCAYDWEGNCVKHLQTPGEIEVGARDQILDTDHFFGRVGFDFEIAPDHALRLSLAPTFFRGSGENRRHSDENVRDPFASEREMLVQVTGVEYEVDALGDRLENIAFAKSYLQIVRSEEPFPDGVFRRRDRDSHHFGFGDGLRYRFHDHVWGKLSYEWATRLPGPDELFGDGALIDANVTLSPETSHNLNLGATVEAPTTLGALRLDVNGFWREADQLIVLLGNENGYVHENVFAARSLGAEAAAGWTSPDERLALDVNGTWVDMRNTSSKGRFGRYVGERIPNRPWLFANLAVRYRIPDTLGAGDGLTFRWYSRWVHEFLRGWGLDGASQFKDTIPSQFVHAVVVTQEVHTRVAALTFGAEIQNLSDARAFDFFGVERPGRSFHFKTTAQF